MNCQFFRFNFFLHTYVHFVASKGILAVLVYIGMQKRHHVKVMFYGNNYNTISLYLLHMFTRTSTCTRNDSCILNMVLQIVL